MEPGTDWPDDGAEVPAGGEDAVVAEVRAARETLLAEAGYDLEALGRLLRERQAAGGRTGVVLPPRDPEPPSRAA